MTSVEFPDALQIVPLQKIYDRTEFDCGEEQVNDWLQTKSLQNQQKQLSITKSLIDSNGKVAGFYTLATGQIDFCDLPSKIVRHLPRRALPVAVLAWLGVSRTHQGHGLGDLLLAQALRD